jgi:hypothetical protein
MQLANAESKNVQGDQNTKDFVQSTTEKIERAIQEIVKFAEIKGFIVRFSNKSEYVIDDNIIYVDSRTTPEKKLFLLAHEVGHALTLQLCIDRFGKKVLFGNESRWPALESEFAAWQKADEILAHLGLYTESYVRLKHKLLAGYYSGYKP